MNNEDIKKTKSSTHWWGKLIFVGEGLGCHTAGAWHCGVLNISPLQRTTGCENHCPNEARTTISEAAIKLTNVHPTNQPGELVTKTLTCIKEANRFGAGPWTGDFLQRFTKQSCRYFFVGCVSASVAEHLWTQKCIIHLGHQTQILNAMNTRPRSVRFDVVFQQKWRLRPDCKMYDDPSTLW